MNSLNAEEKELVGRLRKKYAIPDDLPSKNATTCELGYGPEAIPLLAIVSRLDKEISDLKLALFDRSEKYKLFIDKGLDELYTKNKQLTLALDRHKRALSKCREQRDYWFSGYEAGCEISLVRRFKEDDQEIQNILEGGGDETKLD